MARIPKILHYCFGLAENGRDKPWGLAAHVCVASAIARIRPEKILFYYETEPSGPWWELTRKLVTLVKVTAPREIFGNPIAHPAHRADVIRLQRLIGEGGIYLDTDVVVHRAFDDLLDHSVVLGTEAMGDTVYGTANAVILAEKDAPFLKRWYARYDTFRGRPDKYWSEHSVLLPSVLARRHPDEITVLGPRAFFHPIWLLDQLELIFNSTAPIVFPDTWATHLWDGRSSRYTRGLTPGDVRRHDTNFHRWARPHLEGLADDHGAEGEPIAFESRLAGRAELLAEKLKQKLVYEPKYRLAKRTKTRFD